MLFRSFSTTVAITGAADVLDGIARPGHFNGVATVVTKLLLQILPDIALFGEKDYQQLTVIRRLVADLNILFPEFAEDFVQHIHIEEDRLFRYIGILSGSMRGTINPSALHRIMEKDSIHRFVIEHEAHDDEMEGIRKITADYLLMPDAPLHLEVLYAHLQQLEHELRTHARIENEILFPKAATLEARIRARLTEIARLN